MSAAILNKFLGVLGITDEGNDEELVDMEKDYEEVEEETPYERPARAGYFSRSSSSKKD